MVLILLALARPAASFGHESESETGLSLDAGLGHESESGHEIENETERKRETGTEASRLQVATRDNPIVSQSSSHDCGKLYNNYFVQQIICWTLVVLATIGHGLSHNRSGQVSTETNRAETDRSGRI